MLAGGPKEITDVLLPDQSSLIGLLVLNEQRYIKR